MKKENCKNLPCTCCGITDPSKFYWAKRISKLGETKLKKRSECKVCQSNRKKKEYIKNPTPVLQRNVRWKISNRDYVRQKNNEYASSIHGKAIRTAIQAKRKASLLQRIPLWADLDKITEIYEAASFAKEFFNESIEVDHIIPLQGKIVSGLHVHNNLQLLISADNMKKHNTFYG